MARSNDASYPGTTVRIARSARGAWQVEVPGGPKRCETLEDARRFAHRLAPLTRPFELVVHDAYHRVVERKLIGASVPGRARPPQGIDPG